MHHRLFALKIHFILSLLLTSSFTIAQEPPSGYPPVSDDFAVQNINPIYLTRGRQAVTIGADENELTLDLVKPCASMDAATKERLQKTDISNDDLLKLASKAVTEVCEDLLQASVHKPMDQLCQDIHQRTQKQRANGRFFPIILGWVAVTALVTAISGGAAYVGYKVIESEMQRKFDEFGNITTQNIVTLVERIKDHTRLIAEIRVGIKLTIENLFELNSVHSIIQEARESVRLDARLPNRFLQFYVDL